MNLDGRFVRSALSIDKKIIEFTQKKETKVMTNGRLKRTLKIGVGIE